MVVLNRFLACTAIVLFLTALAPASAADPTPLPPTPPQELSHQYNQTTDALVLEWQPPAFSGNAPIAGYNVYLFGDLIGTTAETRFVHADPEAGIYQVTAWNADAESAPATTSTAGVPEHPMCLRLLPQPMLDPKACVDYVAELVEGAPTSIHLPHNLPRPDNVAATKCNMDLLLCDDD